MRYFKYKNVKDNFNNALAEQYKMLTDNEKRIVRWRKAWERFGLFVTLAVFFSCMTAGLILIGLVPTPAQWFAKLFVIVAKAVAVVLLLIVSGILTAAVGIPLWEKAESFSVPAMKKEIFAQAVAHLRDYYGFGEPYIITKCFDSTDKKFKNHDVCLFVADGELRITADLVNGFLYGARDPGCYAFKSAEIVLSQQREENRTAAQIKAENIEFLLGCRAKSFIEKHFIGR